MCEIGIGIYSRQPFVPDPNCWKMKFRAWDAFSPHPLFTANSDSAYSVELRPDKTFYFALITNWISVEFGLEGRGRVVSYRIAGDTKQRVSAVCLVDTITSHRIAPWDHKHETVIWTPQQQYIDIPLTEINSQHSRFSDQQEKENEEIIHIFLDTLFNVPLSLIQIIIAFSHNCDFPSTWPCLLAAWRRDSTSWILLKDEAPAHFLADKQINSYKKRGTALPPRFATTLDVEKFKEKMTSWKVLCEDMKSGRLYL